jgi:hypothetical protein
MEFSGSCKNFKKKFGGMKGHRRDAGDDDKRGGETGAQRDALQKIFYSCIPKKDLAKPQPPFKSTKYLQ